MAYAIDLETGDRLQLEDGTGVILFQDAYIAPIDPVGFYAITSENGDRILFETGVGVVLTEGAKTPAFTGIQTEDGLGRIATEDVPGIDLAEDSQFYAFDQERWNGVFEQATSTGVPVLGSAMAMASFRPETTIARVGSVGAFTSKAKVVADQLIESITTTGTPITGGGDVAASFLASTSIALVGSLGAFATGAATTVSPAFGQSTIAGNLLVAWVTATSAISTVASGWTQAVVASQVNAISSVWYKPNCSAGETAPTFTCGGGASAMLAQLAEFSGALTASVLGQTASQITINTSPVTANAGAADAGDSLIVGASRWVITTAATASFSTTYNNGITAIASGNSGAATTTGHSNFSYGFNLINTISPTFGQATSAGNLLVGWVTAIGATLSADVGTVTVGATGGFTGGNPSGNAVMASFKAADIGTPIRQVGVGAFITDSNTSVSPAFGQTTSAGSLLLACVSTSAPAPFTSAVGWVQVAQGSGVAIWAKLNCRTAEDAPVFTCVGGATPMMAQLSEWAGVATTDATDQIITGGSAPTVSVVLTAPAVDAAFGDLVILASAWLLNASQAIATITETFNTSGPSLHMGDNATVATTSHATFAATIVPPASTITASDSNWKLAKLSPIAISPANHVSIWYRAKCLANETAPSFIATPGTFSYAQLAEFSGASATGPQDYTTGLVKDTSGLTGITVTDKGNLQPGDLVLVGSRWALTTAATATWTDGADRAFLSSTLTPFGASSSCSCLASFKAAASQTPALVRAGPIVTGTITAVSPTFGQATTAGNLLVAVVNGREGDSTTGATGWAQVVSGNTGGGDHLVIWARPNCGAAEAAPTFTCIGGVGDNMQAILLEFSGVATSTPNDQSGGAFYQPGGTLPYVSYNVFSLGQNTVVNDLIVLGIKWRAGSGNSTGTFYEQLNNNTTLFRIADDGSTSTTDHLVADYAIGDPNALYVRAGGSGASTASAHSVFNYGIVASASNWPRYLLEDGSGVLISESPSSSILTQALNAVLSFVGAVPRRTGKIQGGVLSFTGNVLRKTTHLTTGVLSFTGSQVAKLSRSLSGGVSFTGAFLKQAKPLLTGGLSFTGLDQEKISKALSGGLSFTGAFLKFPKKLLTGGLSFTGAITALKILFRAFTAGLSFTGAFTKRGFKPLAGVLSFTGSDVLKVIKGLSGGLSFAGSVTALKIFFRAFTAGLTFTGAFTKKGLKPLSGGLSFTGAIVRQWRTFLTAVLSFTGADQWKTIKGFAGTLSFTGSITALKVFFRAFTAGLSFTGAISKRGFKTLSGGLSFTGADVEMIGKAATAVLSFTGATTKKTFKIIVPGVLSFSGAVARAFPKALTATLSFTGAFIKRPGKALAGVLSFVGSGRQSISKGLAAGLSFVGAVTRQINRSLTGGLSFAGAIRKAITRSLSGTLSFAGSIIKSLVDAGFSAGLSFSGAFVKQVGHRITGVLSFTGAIAALKFLSQVFTAALSFAGAMQKQTGKRVSGGLSFTGAYTRAMVKLLTAGLSFVGSVLKRVNRALAGVLSFTGALTFSHLFLVALAGALSFVGAISKQTQKRLAGGLSFVGAIFKQAQKALAGGLSFTGAIQRQISKLLSGGLSFVGLILKSISRSLSGTLSFSGAVLKKVIRALSATLSFVGAISASRLVSVLLTGALSFAGAIRKQTGKSLAGGLSFTGAIIRVVGRILAASLSFTGAIRKSLTRAITGTLSFTGAITKQTVRPLAGTLSFVGAVLKQIGKPLAGTLSFTGAISKLLKRALSGTLSFAGTITKSITRSLAGVLAFGGGFTKRVFRALTGTLSFSGAVAVTRVLLVALAGALSFAGAISKRTGKAITGGLSFTGAVQKFIQRSLSAGLSFTGAIRKQVAHLLVATLSFSGLLARGLAYFRSLTATLSFTGAVSKQARKGLSGTLSFSGAIAKRAFHLLTAALSFTGVTLRQINKRVSGVLTFTGVYAGRLVIHYFQTLAGALSFQGALARSTNFVVFMATMAARGSVSSVLSYISTFRFTSRAMFRAVSRAINNMLTKDRDDD